MIGTSKGQPIAIIDRNGCILPFTTNSVDAVHLLKHGVEYIYDQKTLTAALNNNAKYHEKHDFENPRLHVTADRVLRLPAKRKTQGSESRIQIIDPETIQIEMGA